MSESKIIEKLKFNSHGLIPAIIQDWKNNEVLMMAFMNSEAVELTLSTGITHFYSRSRQKLWKKGETSGHIQKVKEIFYDCDNDTLLIKVEQVVAACHTGARSCFFNKIENGKIKFTGKKLFQPEKVYEKNIIEKLDAVIDERKTSTPEKSYVSSLLHSGSEKISKKVIEEALELILSSQTSKEKKDEIIKEAADLWFHTLVLLANKGVKGEDVLGELQRRFGKSGINEKKERKKS